MRLRDRVAEYLYPTVQAVDLLYASAGSTAFRDESPLQKRFRDLQINVVRSAEEGRLTIIEALVRKPA